jgi:hypothetical protein
MQIFICVALLALSAMIYLPLPTPLVLGLLMLTGLMLGGMVTGFALSRLSNPVAVTGAAYAFVNTAVTATGALFLPLIGWLLDLNWDGSLREGARLYSAEAYRLGFSVLPAFLLLGLLASFAIKEENLHDS